MVHARRNAGINVYAGPLTGGPSRLFFAGTATFNTVPEPAAWALIIAGFALTGTALRRRTMGAGAA